ncbi:MAG: hypothetical protein Kow0099_17960 [Candidatus Abyssubacteria bacterium]
MNKKRNKRHRKRGSKQTVPTETREPIPLLNRRALEKSLVDVCRALEGREFESDKEMDAYLKELLKTGISEHARVLTPLEKAQDLMYEAWGSKGKRRLQLAREALQICPDCADAYVLLAEETATSAEEAVEFYTKAMQAGERALGEEFFTSEAGNFWYLIETRPYMRARAGLAGVLGYLGETEAGLEHCMELLRLNPNDDQAIRYLAAQYLFVLKRYKELKKLLNQYDEQSTFWCYSRALHEYLTAGDTRKARRALIEAVDMNPFVAAFLLGMREPPDEPPDYYSPGDVSEAVIYMDQFSEIWFDSKEAFAWLVLTLAKAYVNNMIKEE